MNTWVIVVITASVVLIVDYICAKHLYNRFITYLSAARHDMGKRITILELDSERHKLNVEKLKKRIALISGDDIPSVDDIDSLAKDMIDKNMM